VRNGHATTPATPALPPLDAYLKERSHAVDRALDHYLPRANRKPETIHKAMRYSIFAGGKRLRPILCLAAAEACGGEIAPAMPAACAVECLHTYSLIHDDLPCMDDDDFRRGRPTSHKVYGEGIAVLAGDALLTLSFGILAQAPATPRYSPASMIADLTDVAGSLHLIGGQVADLEAESNPVTPRQLRYIHESKTAALLAGSLRLGAMSANATPRKLEQLSQFGENLGLAFQIIDDILDVTQTAAALGKSPGKDAAANKATYPALIGLDAARAEAAKLTTAALANLEPFGKKAGRLRQIAEFLLQRES